MKWDALLPASPEVEHNRPDLTLVFPASSIASKRQVAYIIVVTVCADNLAAERCKEKTSKYMPLAKSAISQSGAQLRVLAIAVRCTGAICEGTVGSLGVLKVTAESLQRAAAIGSVRIAQRVLRSYG